MYGEDGRVEAYEAGAQWAQLVDETVVAIIPSDRLVLVEPGIFTVEAATLGEDRELCEGELFADQPAAANCTGALVDDRIVMTAGHCISDASECRRLSFVFGYRYDEEGELRIPSSDIFTCNELIVRERRLADRLKVDYAFVSLDRPTRDDFRPARLLDPLSRIEEGTAVTLVGFPGGIPAKVDEGGVVQSNRDNARDYFVVSSDSFSGNSGGAVFLSDGTVAGVLVRGLPDYERDGACSRVFTLDPESAAEEVTMNEWAIRTLCDLPDADRPSTNLCFNSSLPCLGDGACESTSPPSQWFCPLALYDDGGGCDCNCGWPDPDCDDPTLLVYDCPGEEMCNSVGMCGDEPDVPDAGADTGDAGDDSDADDHGGDGGGKGGGCAVGAGAGGAVGWWWIAFATLLVRRATRLRGYRVG